MYVEEEGLEEVGGKKHVQGFIFSEEIGRERNGTICQIVRRASEGEVSDSDLLLGGAAFWVKFGDGAEMIAWSHQLHPWYAT